MSSPHAAEMPPLLTDQVRGLRLPWPVVMATALAILGLFSILPTIDMLWGLWTTDALKSIGMVIPPISLLLVLRAWRRLGWEMQGTWWGLAIVVTTVVAVHLREKTVLAFILTPQWTIFLPPDSLVIMAYGMGMALLFGGTRLFRAALFPLVLLWFVNPIPHVFNVLVDLPLQQVSAHVARAFARALGQPLTPDQMRLMFTPDFGMFIAPGCNGIRGSITMGFIALIAGYVYRFRAYTLALVVAGAVLLGYIFNFVRLCVLVIYYIVALHFTSWQAHGEGADYAIGGCLFFVATMLLFTAIQRLRSTNPEPPLPPADVKASGFIPRAAALAVFLLAGSSAYLYAAIHNRIAPPATAIDARVLGTFPQKLGAYTLSRTWNEYSVGQPVLFYWADYAPADDGAHIAIGISPFMEAHDSLICHSARGEDPLWVDTLIAPTLNEPTSFSASFFNGGSTQYVEATTMCTGGGCGEYNTNRTHFGFVYSHPDPSTLFGLNPQRAIPILLKAETLDTQLPPQVAREELLSSMRGFLSNVSLPAITAPYRKM